jgi:hypothetical protein
MPLNPDRANPPADQEGLHPQVISDMYVSERGRFNVIRALQRFAIDNPGVADNPIYRTELDLAVEAWAEEFEALP